MIFGAGWSITGACPGPIYAQIGGGAWMALFTLAGAMSGMFLYAWLQMGRVRGCVSSRTHVHVR